MVLISLACFPALLGAQDFQPPVGKPLEEKAEKLLAEKTATLGQRVRELRQQGVTDPVLADIEIYYKAAVWIMRHKEFFQKEAADWTSAVLDRGLLRGSQAAQGQSPWLRQTGTSVVRAYRSRVDGSVQPYAVTFPAEYGKQVGKRWRIDVVLHGRDAGLTEVKFLHQHAGRAAAKDQDWVQLDLFGRGNNAYRWAGEADVREAVAHFLAVEYQLGRDALLDTTRKVLRGFSMGGAGTWHLGLHYPDAWSVLGPGAGFTTTHGYIKTLPAKLPAYQEACLHIYDALDYAENAFNVAVVAYSGDQDPQMQAAKNIEAKLRPLGIPMTHLVAPGLGHQFPAEWRKKAEQLYSKYSAPGRPDFPPRVRFVTYTLKYQSCDWVELLGLERHYEQAKVDAERTEAGFKVTTANVRAMRLTAPAGPALPLRVQIDGQELEARPYVNAAGMGSLYLERREGKWAAVLPQKLVTDRLRRPQKMHGLQGPIDDAFMDSFLCVRGTGKPWHEATEKYARANLERFQAEWNKFLRGDLPVKDDVDVTEEDLATRHLILFGDPSSNALIGHTLGGLPMQWTAQGIFLAEHKVGAAEHVPVLIYPSPLNSGRYVVLNSGHTFRAADFRGTNALLYPRLGDYAILRPSPKDQDPAAAEVVTAGLFDDFWQLPRPVRRE